MMNDDSYNISISFKTNLAQLNMMQNACQSHYMSRSDLIRSGVILMMSKLSKNKLGVTSSSNTSNTDILDVSSMIDEDVPSPSMFGSTSPQAVAPIIDDDLPFAPSIYADFQ